MPTSLHVPGNYSIRTIYTIEGAGRTHYALSEHYQGHAAQIGSGYLKRLKKHQYTSWESGYIAVYRITPGKLYQTDRVSVKGMR